LNLRPLGYEPYDMRLRRLGSSLLCGLTSADVRPLVACGRPHPPRIGLSRCVSFTDRFTETMSELRLSRLFWRGSRTMATSTVRVRSVLEPSRSPPET
jgi:hypothetical protein